MTNKLSVKNYIAIADWMLDLNLNTRELLCYAIIYGFSQSDPGFYYGSLEYLANWLGVDDRSNVTRYLKPLVEQGLVVKKEVTMKSNQKGCLYKAVLNKGPIIKNPDIDYIIIQPWMMQQMHLGGKDLLLYALIHGYSRKDSSNVCNYDKNYFSKWIQVRKNNVDRQVNRLLDQNLIKRVGDNSFMAVVPSDLKLTQIDNTPLEDMDIDLTQIDNTYSQIDNTPRLKLTTNNLHIENLQDNVLLSNDNKEQNNLEYSNPDSLSVVVNRQVPQADFSLDYERDAFSYKKEIDFESYRKQKKTKIDLASFLSKFSVSSFRYLLATWPEDRKKVKKAQDLLVSATISNRFKGKESEIDNLSEENVTDLFHTCYDFCDSNGQGKGVRSPKAYLIGMISNMIEEQ